MYAHIIAVGDVSCIFFVILQVFGKYVLLNLFLAILLENFEEIETNELHANKDAGA
jgi:Ion transport protein